MRKNKKWAIILASAMAVVMLVSGTFAWFTASDYVDNRLKTSQIDDGSASIVEVFTPPENWEPGMEVTKKVAVANTGTGTLLVRVSYEEILTKLSGKAKGYTVSELNGLTADQRAALVPVNYNPESFNNSNGYYASTDSQFQAQTGLDPVKIVGFPADGTVIKVRKELSGQNENAYSFIIYKDFGNGVYQKMTADCKAVDDTLTISNVNYWNYPGTTTTAGAWSEIDEHLAPPYAPITYPDSILTPPTNYNTSGLDNKLLLNYSPSVFANLNDAVAAGNAWWYNADDGYFYYIGSIGSGQVTNELLQSIELDYTADSTYASMDYHLIIAMRAIQNSVEAITSTEAGGWGLTNPDLIAALTAYCS